MSALSIATDVADMDSEWPSFSDSEPEFTFARAVKKAKVKKDERGKETRKSDQNPKDEDCDTTELSEVEVVDLTEWMMPKPPSTPSYGSSFAGSKEKKSNHVDCVEQGKGSKALKADVTTTSSHGKKRQVAEESPNFQSETPKKRKVQKPVKTAIEDSKTGDLSTPGTNPSGLPTAPTTPNVCITSSIDIQEKKAEEKKPWPESKPYPVPSPTKPKFAKRQARPANKTAKTSSKTTAKKTKKRSTPRMPKDNMTADGQEQLFPMEEQLIFERMERTLAELVGELSGPAFGETEMQKS